MLRKIGVIPPRPTVCPPKNTKSNLLATPLNKSADAELENNHTNLSKNFETQCIRSTIRYKIHSKGRLGLSLI